MTYPNVLVMGYLKATGQLTPELRMKLEHAIQEGYQRMFTFEAATGGFDWYGRSPGSVLLTAYGLQVLGDMAKVHDVDPAFVDRIARWLVAQRRGDGSFPSEGAPHRWRALDPSDLAATAYAAWALVQAGHRADAEPSIAWLRGKAAEAQDPYLLALVANAFAAYHPEQDYAREAVDRLAGMARDGAWQAGMESFTGSRGATLDLELTALATHALLQGRGDPALVDRALERIVRQRDANGTWGGSTQATVLAIKALVAAAEKGTASVRGKLSVRVALDGGPEETVTFEEGKTDYLQQVFFPAKGRPGTNRVRLSADADGGIGWQVVGRAWTPGRPAAPEASPLALKMTLDRTELATRECIRADVEVGTRAEGPTFMVIADLGIPPGFDPVASDLEDLVARGVIDKFAFAGRRVTVYLGMLAPEAPIRFSYRLQARLPVKAAVPASEAYEYYAPERRAAARGLPETVEVR